LKTGILLCEVAFEETVGVSVEGVDGLVKVLFFKKGEGFIGKVGKNTYACKKWGEGGKGKPCSHKFPKKEKSSKGKKEMKG